MIALIQAASNSTHRTDEVLIQRVLATLPNVRHSRIEECVVRAAIDRYPHVHPLSVARWCVRDRRNQNPPVESWAGEFFVYLALADRMLRGRRGARV